MINENELELTTLDLVVKGMLEKKAEDVVILDLANIKIAVTDYFVICSANSDTQADAISTAVQEEVWKAHRQHAYGKEGFQQKEWILLDYGDVVAHIFRKDRREFYALEELWGDAIVVEADAEFEKALYRRLSGEPEEIKSAIEDIKVIKLAENKSGTKKTSAVVKKAGSKTIVKSSAGKKATVKKAAVKKVAEKKIADASKTAAKKKTTAKKVTAKSKSESAKKVVKKDVATKKVATKSKSTKASKTAKPVAKKKAVKSSSSKPTKKATSAKVKKAPAKKTTTTKKVVKKAVAKKAVAKKKVVKKSVAKKVVAKKTTAKKVVAKKVVKKAAAPAKKKKK